MRIQNALVFDEDCRFRSHEVFIQNGKICSRAEYMEKPDKDDDETIDAKGLYLIPGLIDIHSHGACGADVSDGDWNGLKELLAYEKAAGITTYCPTLMSLPKERLLELCASFGQWAEQWEQPNGEQALRYSRIAGLHMEGPFLMSSKRGAQKKEYLCLPDAAFLEECIRLSKKRLRMVTLAPELEGALELIERFRGKIRFSLGHTEADYDTAKQAMEAGAKHVAHLLNAMPPFAHRSPGPVGAAWDTPDCTVELICDGVHVHESMVRAVFALFQDRVVLISDSMRAAGLRDGTYTLGGQEVVVCGRQARNPDHTLAGSVCNLMECMQKAVAFGVPKEAAIAAATANPAKSIGIYDRVGSVTAGKYADLLLTDEALRLVRVL